MQIILKQDVPKLGYSNDIVEVKPGYARNYLIPQGIAVLATPSTLKMREENMRQAAHKLEQRKREAEEKARELESITLELPTKVGTSGKIFGSITTQQIARELKAKGYEIDRRRISFDQDIREAGSYSVTVDLHKEVKAVVPIEVIPEQQTT
jgi:large subunit ribosomal protein L9